MQQYAPQQQQQQQQQQAQQEPPKRKFREFKEEGPAAKKVRGGQLTGCLPAWSWRLHTPTAKPSSSSSKETVCHASRASSGGDNSNLGAWCVGTWLLLYCDVLCCLLLSVVCAV
jgi:hypothetical protein